MNKPDEITELRLLIRLKELEHKAEGQLLREDFRETFQSLRPSNIIRSTLKEVSSAPGIKGVIINAAVSIAGAYIAKKIATPGLLTQLLNGFLNRKA